MSDPVIGVLALQGDVREHLAALQDVGARTATVRTSSDLDEVDALVIPGGESTTMWRLASRLEVLQPLRERVSGGMPAYGSCAGMIMLADRLEGGVAGQETVGGLDVTVRRNAFGRQVDSFEADLDFPALRESPHLHAVFIRAPWVESVGDGVDVLARVAAGPAAGRIVAVRQGPVMATSFHPELTGDTRVHGLFLETVREALAASERLAPAYDLNDRTGLTSEGEPGECPATPSGRLPSTRRPWSTPGAGSCLRS